MPTSSPLILVINSGSSSLKYSLIDIEQENLLDHMLGTMRHQRLHEKLLGIREGDRVVVYNQ